MNTPPVTPGEDSGTAVYLNAIATLSAALRDIRDCTGTSTEAHHFARKALDDVDHLRPQQPAPELAAAMAEVRKVRALAARILGAGAWSNAGYILTADREQLAQWIATLQDGD